MPKLVKAVCGDHIVVVELSKNVYALVNEDICLFAHNPDSFYKQGYFEEPTEPFTVKRIKELLNSIHNSIESMTQDNAHEYCLGRIKKEEIEEAYNGLTSARKNGQQAT